MAINVVAGMAVAAALVAFSPASAEVGPSTTFNLCASAPDTAGIFGAVAGQNPTIERLRGLIDQTVSIRVTASGYEITSGGIVSTTASHYPPRSEPRRGPCSGLGPTTVVLSEIPTIPGEVLATYGAVRAFRKSFTWPSGAANLDDLTTEVRFAKIANNNASIFVGIAPAPKPLDLTCIDEHYRVDIPSLIVRPYEGCVEIHSPSGLPRLSDLPPPNTPL